MGIRDLRLIAVLAALRAGGMRVRLRDFRPARRALAAAGPRPGAVYEALESVLRPAPHEREVFDAVVLGGLPGAARVLPPGRRRRPHG